MRIAVVMPPARPAAHHAAVGPYSRSTVHKEKNNGLKKDPVAEGVGRRSSRLKGAALPTPLRLLHMGSATMRITQSAFDDIEERLANTKDVTVLPPDNERLLQGTMLKKSMTSRGTKWHPRLAGLLLAMRAPVHDWHGAQKRFFES